MGNTVIFVASDHGGYGLKQTILHCLQKRQLAYQDLGVHGEDSVDYPDYAFEVAQAVVRGEATAGILLCGTGIGMSIAANKIPGVRAALAQDAFTGRMAKEHNNANILVLGGRVLDPQQACAALEAWLDARFDAGRHQRRLDKIAQLEAQQ